MAYNRTIPHFFDFTSVTVDTGTGEYSIVLLDSKGYSHFATVKGAEAFMQALGEAVNYCKEDKEKLGDSGN
jgi:hypothetical protein